MAKGIATIEIKKRKGHPTIMGMGKTPRGQKFIRVLKPLATNSMSNPAFKKEMAQAIAEIFA